MRNALKAGFIGTIVEQEAMENFVFPDLKRTIEEFDENK